MDPKIHILVSFFHQKPFRRMPPCHWKVCSSFNFFAKLKMSHYNGTLGRRGVTTRICTPAAPVLRTYKGSRYRSIAGRSVRVPTVQRGTVQYTVSVRYRTARRTQRVRNRDPRGSCAHGFRTSTSQPSQPKELTSGDKTRAPSAPAPLLNSGKHLHRADQKTKASSF